jgi:tetratricopeptide (TPR) repeat protein
MRGVLMTLVALLVLCGALRARAEAPDPFVERAKVHLRSGIAYYEEGRYEEALREMQAAYQAKPIADLKYNLAQCYERLGRLDEAAESYRAYLVGHPRPDDEQVVRARISNLEVRLKRRAEAEEAALQAARDQQAAAPPPPPPPPPVEIEKVVFKTIVVYKTAPPKPGRGARFGAYTAFGVGAAALATALAFTVEGRRAGDEVARRGNVAEPIDYLSVQALEQRSRDGWTIAAAGYAVTAVAAAIGGGFMYLGKKIDAEAPPLTLAPLLGPQLAGLSLGGRL